VPVICACSTRDLWAPDEPRYGQVAREMLESGDWLVPHANGRPYAEKPPLYWWGAALLSLPGGRVSAVSARLAGALYALGCVFLLGLLVRRWFRDPLMGVTAAALFSGTLLIGWQAPRAGLDLPLTFWILLALERGTAFLRSGSAWAALGCGAAWAGAVLVKGPLGFLFPPIAIAAAAWGGRQAPRWKNPGWFLIPLVLVGLGLAWLLPAVEAGGAAYADRLLGQIRGRATGAEGHHIRPIWYFLERGTVWSLPWALHFLAGVLVCLRIKRAPAEDRAGLAACLALGVGGFVFLSLIATKREVYMVPLFPFTAMAAAYALHRGTTPALARWGTRLAVGLSAGIAVLLLAAPFVARALADAHPRIPDEVMGGSAFAVFAPAAAAFLLAAWAGVSARQDPARVVRRMTPLMLTGLTFLVLVFLPRLDTMKSYAPAATAAETWAEGGPVYNAGFGQGPNLLWSLDRKHTEALLGIDDLRAALAADRPHAAVVAAAKWWDRLREQDPAATVGILEVWRDEKRHRGLVVLTQSR